MKTFLIIALIVLTWLGCRHQNKKEQDDLVIYKTHQKLSAYKESVDILSEHLMNLNQQFEVAEEDIILQIKEFQLMPNDQALQHFMKAVEKKESVEGQIEKTILEINTLADSVLVTENRIQEGMGSLMID
ncbi:MAG: hypothetical protein JJE09_11920 [Bacteroidia bacterium]|nr:hypothetical protein [Bacteroidia bacterium]